MPQERMTTNAIGTEGCRTSPFNTSDANAGPDVGAEALVGMVTATLGGHNALWLSVLTKSESLKLAAGEEWQPGDPHPFNCFVCNLANGLLDCRLCSRSYHPRCLDPPLENDHGTNSWACPACALLGVDGATHVYDINEPRDRREQVALRMIRFFGHRASDKIPANGKRNRLDETERDRFGKKRLIEGVHEYQGPIKSPANAPSTNSSNLKIAASRQWITATAQKKDDQRRPTAAHRLANPHELIFLEQSGNLSSAYDHTELKKRSRYSTLPDDVDEALATINRQLEAGAHSKNMLDHLTAKNHALEQELQIERGKVLLAARSQQQEAETNALRSRVEDMEIEIKVLREQNQKLKNDAETSLKKIKNLEVWKRRMRSMMDGDMEDEIE